MHVEDPERRVFNFLPQAPAKCSSGQDRDEVQDAVTG